MVRVAIHQPTFSVLSESQASTISKTDKIETPEQRMNSYLKYLPQAKGNQISGRNVWPDDSTPEFVKAVSEFLRTIN